MELVLKKDVPNLGFKDEVVKVKPGYGRNYLIPQGFAILATRSVLKAHTETQRQRQHKEEALIKEYLAYVEKANTLQLTLYAKTSDDGKKIFGSITPADIAQALNKQGVPINKIGVSIVGAKPKATGTYETELKFHKKVTTRIKFDIVAEEKTHTKK